MSLVPFMPTFGNPDALSKDYADRFALPRNAPGDAAELYYSFEYSNAKFIVLNDNYLIGYNVTKLEGPEYVWLEEQLKSNRKDWLFVVNHQPFYSSSNKHGSDKNLQRVWMPLLDKYHVDMVFNGHDHNYERSKPMRGDAVQSSPEDGVTYVVAAGMGAPLYDNGSNFFTAKSEKIENYVVVEVDGLSLKMMAKRLDGTVIDEFNRVRTPRVFAANVTVTTVTPESVFGGPLWHCSSGGPVDLFYVLVPMLWLAFNRRRT
jgi:3',5'-cyclic AMP phosphodiesterase CpdA